MRVPDGERTYMTCLHRTPHSLLGARMIQNATKIQHMIHAVLCLREAREEYERTLQKRSRGAKEGASRAAFAQAHAKTIHCNYRRAFGKRSALSRKDTNRAATTTGLKTLPLDCTGPPSARSPKRG